MKLRELIAMLILGLPFHGYFIGILFFCVLGLLESLFFNIIGRGLVINIINVFLSISAMIIYAFTISFIVIKILNYKNVIKALLGAVLLQIFFSVLIKLFFIERDWFEFTLIIAAIVYWPTCLISLAVLKMYKLKSPGRGAQR